MGNKFTGKSIKLEWLDVSVYPTTKTVVRDFTCFANDAEISKKRGDVDVTAFCSTGKDFIGGMSEEEFSAKIYHEDGTYADSSQKDLEDIYASAIPQPFRLRPQGVGTGKPEILFLATLLEVKTAYSNSDEPMMSDCSFKISGASTVATQS